MVDPTSLAQLECIPMAYLAPLNSFQNHSYFGDSSGGNNNNNMLSDREAILNMVTMCNPW